MKIATWNTRGYTNKEYEIDKSLNEREIDFAVLSETKKKGSGTNATENYITIYSGVPKTERAAAGVMICVHKKHRNKIKTYNIWHERIISVRMEMEQEHITIIGTYAPEEGRREELNDDFYECLQKVIQRMNPEDYVILAGDMNARVGNRKVSRAIGTFGLPEVNRNGERLTDFCIYNQLRAMNTFFRHKEKHKITWSARGSYSLIDYVIANEKAAKRCIDVRSYRGADVGSDHYLVQASFRLTLKQKKRNTKGETAEKRIKVRGLDDETTKWLYQKRLDIVSEKVPIEENLEEEWHNIKNIIGTAAKESLGMVRTKKPEKSLRNWDPEIDQLCKEKRLAFRKWINSGKQEDRLEYKRRSAMVKRKSRKIQRESWENFTSYLEQETYKLRPKVYKIIRRIDSNFNERIQLPKLDMEEAKTFYRDLWTDSNEQIESEEHDKKEEKTAETVNAPITMKELEEALKKSKNAKAPGEDGLSIELYKYSSSKFKKRLLNFINSIWEKETTPEEFRNAIVVPLYKKGDMAKPENYRGICLLNTCYKIYAKIIAKRINEITEEKVLEYQNGFRGGRSCTDASFTIKLLMEKRIEYDLETHMCFVDLEKAYDNVDRRILRKVLEKYEIPPKLIRIVDGMYKNTGIKIRIGEELSSREDISKGVRQGCPLSCTLFNLYMDAITREWMQTNPRGVRLANNKQLETMLFADDQVILAEDEDELQRSMFKLENIARRYGMKISTQKTKTMAFRGKEAVRSKIVINRKIIEQVSSFNYLGVNMSYNGETDVHEKIKRFLKVTGLINRTLNANKTRRETRLKVYNTLAVPMLTYGSETWALKKSEKKRIEAAEMRFMRRTAGVTLRDRKRSEEIRETLNVTPVIKRIKQYRKNWREHVGRMEENRSPRTVLEYTPRGKRPTGRPRKRMLDTSGSSTEGEATIQ